MKRYKVLLGFSLAITLFLIPFSAGALEKVSIAFIDFEGNEVPPSLCQAMSDVARTVLVNSGRFTITERERISAIMKEQALQQSGVTGKEKAVKLGQMLNVQKLIIGSLSLAGETYLINITLVDVQNAEVEAGDIEKYSGPQDFLSESVEKVIKRLVEKIPLTGNIIKVDVNGLVADIGSKQGITPGAVMKISRKADTLTDLQGKVIGVIEDDIAEAQVEKVGDNWSRLTLTNSEYAIIQIGDYVRLASGVQKKKPAQQKPPEEKKEEKKEEKTKEEPLVPVVF